VLSRLFRKPKLALGGRIILNSLPPSQGHIVKAILFPVEGLNAHPPYSGRPPGKAFIGSEEIAKNVHIGQIVENSSLEVSFNLVAERGYYYLGITVFLFRESPKGLVAHLERFCVGSSPFDLNTDSLSAGDLSIPWPDIAFKDMQVYATFRPNEPPELYDDELKTNV